MTPTGDAHIDEICGFLEEQLGLEALTADTDLFADGGLDSMQLVELFDFVETRFGVELPKLELRLEAISTPRKLAALARGATE